MSAIDNIRCVLEARGLKRSDREERDNRHRRAPGAGVLALRPSRTQERDEQHQHQHAEHARQLTESAVRRCTVVTEPDHDIMELEAPFGSLDSALKPVLICSIL